LADTTKDDPGTTPPPVEAAPPVEQDQLFRLQMAFSDFLLGNAKYFGYLVGLLLLGTLVYGGVTSWLTSREAEEFASISRIDFKMPKVEQLAQFGLAPMDDKTDAARMANVEEGARRYTAVGDEAHGAAAVYAYLKAADAWERVDKPDQVMIVLQKASEVGAKDLPGYTAGAAYAAALIDAGKTDEALALYRDMAGRFEGFYAERSLILLADAQIAAGRQADAKLVIAEFKQRFPQSPRTGEVAALEARAGSAG
jgi:tetratricopeptide (TPR) repeat protein